MNVIERDLRDHAFMLQGAFQIENGRIISINPKYSFEYEKEWLAYANCNKAMRFVFANTDYNALYTEYIKSINIASDIIRSCTDDDLEKMICTMEYIRLMVTYEFVCTQKNANKEEKEIQSNHHTFAGAGINAAIMGRGICQSQASFCRDILNELGIEARFLSLSSINHADVLVENKGVLDPTNYVGTIDSLAGGKLFKEANLDTYSDFSWIDKDTFNKVTLRLQMALIRYLGIDAISEALDLSSLNQTEKQFVIWCFLAKNITPMDKKENSYTVNIKGHEIEITNLLELFYRANGIPIKMSSKHTAGNFRHEVFRIFETVIDGEPMSIIPRISIKEGDDMHGLITPIAYTRDLSSYKIYRDEILRAKDFYKSREDKINELKALATSVI